jgi:hypothetical protein
VLGGGGGGGGAGGGVHALEQRVQVHAGDTIAIKRAFTLVLFGGGRRLAPSVFHSGLMMSRVLIAVS